MRWKNFSVGSVEKTIGLLATVMISASLFLYAKFEPQRIEAAQSEQLNNSLDSAMALYAQNCTVCHGASGEGIGANPPLNTEMLAESDPVSLSKIISRGLYGTAMAPWHIEDGGSLGDHQIGQLVDLLRFGDWSATRNRVAELGLTPLVPFNSEPEAHIIDELKTFPEGDQLLRGLTLYGENCIACHGSDGQGTALAATINDPSVRAKNPEEVERTIKNGVPGTLMAGWGKILSEQEVADLMELIWRWDELPVGAFTAPEQVTVITADQINQGAELYSASCSSCHAPEGQGSQHAPALNVKAFLEDTPDQAIKQIVTLGVPETKMPAWGDRMSESQIEALVGFIRSWEPNAPEAAVPIRMRGPWSSGTGGAPALPSGGVRPDGQGKGVGAGYQGGRNPNSTSVPDVEKQAAEPAAMGQYVPSGSLNTQHGQQIDRPEQNHTPSRNLSEGQTSKSEMLADEGAFIKILTWWAEIEGLGALMATGVVGMGLLMVLFGLMGYARAIENRRSS